MIEWLSCEKIKDLDFNQIQQRNCMETS